ncbi:MAG: type II secretion system inner membrane protein GspF [Desulfuromonadaceae bacterium]|nr:type II secretion system inner membrane protein GspF [Desulfuromonas sp.]MDY0184335.1 type II secretion system inner membrane protein GspF [Desulfuromonadaceae bacterium]
MALFDYTGFDQKGKNTKGTIEAGGKRAALEKLRRQDIYVSNITEQRRRRSESKLAQFMHTGSVRLNTAELATSTRLLATLLEAGVPLDESLVYLAEQSEKGAHRRLFEQIRASVLQGISLHKAMEEQGKTFPQMYRHMVQVGESSGSLDKVLMRLADFLEEQARLKSKTLAALAYPALMALVGTGVLLFLVTFVVPKVTRMLTDMGQTLPGPTRFLIATSDFLSAYGWICLLLLGLGIAALLRYRTTAKGRLKLDGLILKVPLFGNIVRSIATARFSRTLGTLLQSGVPLLQALEISNSLLQNSCLHQSMARCSKAVREGASLAQQIREAALFPPLMAQMTAIGERSGNIDTMLLKVADNQEREIDITLGGLLSLLEPVMILVMGTVIGFIVLAVLLPIFQASQGLG